MLPGAWGGARHRSDRYVETGRMGRSAAGGDIGGVGVGGSVRKDQCV